MLTELGNRQKRYTATCNGRDVVQRVLRAYLPPTAVVHHVNGNPRDNRPCNLVVCQDRKYHVLLHARQDALDQTGDANATHGVATRIGGAWKASERRKARAQAKAKERAKT